LTVWRYDQAAAPSTPPAWADCFLWLAAVGLYSYRSPLRAGGDVPYAYEYRGPWRAGDPKLGDCVLPFGLYCRLDRRFAWGDHAAGFLLDQHVATCWGELTPGTRRGYWDWIRRRG
jgi:hypothetical protein